MGSNDAATIASNETVWINGNRFYDAESRYYEVTLAEQAKRKNPDSPASAEITTCSDMKLPVEKKQNKGVSEYSLASEIAYARQKIQNCLKSGDSSSSENGASIVNRLEKLEKGHEVMKQKFEKLTSDMTDVLSKLTTIEKFMKQFNNQAKETSQTTKKEDSKVTIQNGSSAAANDDDDIDLFGSDEDDASATKLREERLQAYANKKAKKPALVAKSSVVLDVKPWDDETDMKAMEKAVRGVQTEGLVWGASKFVPLAYGINKLQIVAVVEDEKVSIDWLQETICEIEDLVQSVDIAAFNKL